jgi:hypothetical protein
MALSMQQMASTGDYLKIGDPIFRFVSNERLRAYLPFPESAAPRLKIGMPVRLLSPLAPDSPSMQWSRIFARRLAKVQPGDRRDCPPGKSGHAQGGGSVDATVITGRKDNALSWSRNNRLFCVPPARWSM